jgi:hypothetical protein
VSLIVKPHARQLRGCENPVRDPSTLRGSNGVPTWAPALFAYVANTKPVSTHRSNPSMSDNHDSIDPMLAAPVETFDAEAFELAY